MPKMILKYYFLLILLVSAAAITCVEAARLRNFPVTIMQPDGVVIHCLASGDEYYNWLHDENGFTIIQDPSTGYYTYAVVQDGKLVSSGHIVGRADAVSLGLPANAHVFPQRPSREALGSRQGSPLDPGTILNAPRTGTLNNLVIFIRFSDDSEFSKATSSYDAKFNSVAGGANSMRNYYVEASYSQLTISTTFYPAPSGGLVTSFQDSHPRDYFRPYNAATNPIGYTDDTDSTNREHTLLANAVNAVGSQVPPGLNIDGDGDGNVDNVCFIVKGAPDAWNDLLWPHMWSLYTQAVYINSKRVITYNFQLEEALESSGVGVLAHEMFHSLGAPDLYHYTVDLQYPAAEWDLMDMDLNPPQHMTAYMKMRYGTWLGSIPTLSVSGTYSLNPLTSSSNNAFKILSPYSTTEYFVVEYRKKTGTFESSLPGEGVIVYRINSARDGQGNADGPPDELYVYRPDGTLFSNGDSTLANFNSTVGRTAINDLSNPSSFLSTGWAGGLNISNIGAAGSTISFNVSFPLADQPNLAPYQPAGWSDKIVVSKVTGTTTDSSPIYPTDSLYLDWAVTNVGGGPTAAGFYTYLFVDGLLKNSWYNAPPLNAGAYTSILDYPIGTLSATAHSILIIHDVTSLITESNESDNLYSRIIIVSPSGPPNLTPHKPAEWSDKIVVSNVSGTTTDTAVLCSTDSLYLDWAVVNSGTSPVAVNFYTKLMVDNVLKTSWQKPPLDVGAYTSLMDYSLGTLSVGAHTLQIVADSTGVVTESDEADNQYSRSIQVVNCSCSTLTTHVNPQGTGTVQVETAPNCGGGGKLGEGLRAGQEATPRATFGVNMARSEQTTQTFASLLAQAQATGSAKVIVQLGMNFLPEGMLGSPAAVQMQRSQIAQAQEGLLKALAASSVSSVKKFKYIPYVAMEVDAAGLERLRGLSQVIGLEEDVAYPSALAESVPLIGGTAAWAAGYTGSGQTVAILDTGTDKTHPFLSGKVVSEACYSTNGATTASFCPGGVSQSTAPGSGVPCGIEGCKHGTHTAGIAAGKGAEFSGVAKDANLIAIQVFTRFNNASDCGGLAPCALSFISDQTLGLERVLELSGSLSIASVNISIGGGRFTTYCDTEEPAMKAAIDNLRAAGIATAISSGNNGFTDAICGAACMSSAISVGSTDDGSGGTTADVVSEFSNSASILNLLAPGRAINSSVPGGGFEVLSGTSMAAPHVAGAFAVLKSKLPSLTVDQMLAALTTTGVLVVDSRNGLAKPRIQLDAALNSLDVVSFNNGTVVTLTAVPAVGYRLQSWTNCDTPSGNSCTVTMNAARTVTANFEPGNSNATMTTPLPGSTLSSSSVTFTWSAGSGATEYYLQVGTTQGGQELYSVSEGTHLSATVMALPTDGSTVYVRLWSKIAGLWSFNDYTYTSCTGCTATKAAMTTPAPGSTLSSSMTTFWWTASLGSECYLQVGTTLGGQQLYSAGQGTNLSVQVPTLPTNGSPVYARLWTNIGGAWLYNDYTYTACSGCTATKAAMTSPTSGSTLTSASVTFTWSNSLASQYYLQVGTAPGGQQIYSAGQGTSLSTGVSGLPIGGGNVYVRLWSNVSGAWLYNDYSYLACSGCTPTMAVMTSPAAGSTLNSTMVTFTWSSSLASECYLQVGTTPGGQEIYSAGEGTSLSSQVLDIPNNGSAVYVRLWSKIGGAWLFNDYSYTACTGCTATKAAMLTPAPGSTLSSRVVTFTWSGSLAAEYYLFVGTTAGGQEIYSAGQGTNLSTGVTGLPNNGSTVHVRLWSRIGGAWLYSDYAYLACTGCQ